MYHRQVTKSVCHYFISPEVDNKIMDLVGQSSDKVMRNMILVEKASVNSSTR